MPIDTKKILKRADKMEKEIELAKASKKERWKAQSLKDSLYNDENGKRIPRDSDINQSDYSHPGYSLKGYALQNCYLLSNLMGLARKNPNFIQNELIKVVDDDTVEVSLYEAKMSTKTKKVDEAVAELSFLEFVFEPGSRKTYEVSKEEATKWETLHLALWPVVIEIAYAKHLKYISAQKEESNVKNVIQLELKKELMRAHADDPNVTEKEIDEQTQDSMKKLLEDKNLRQFFKYGGCSAEALTHLTGARSKQKFYTLKKIYLFARSKGVPYTSEENYIYKKINKKLNNGKIITVYFYDNEKQDYDSVASDVNLLAFSLKKDAEKTVDALVSRDVFTKKKYEKWLKDRNLKLKDLKGEGKYKDKLRKEFILETVDYGHRYKISKTQSGIHMSHSYVVLDTVEKGGYKYIVLKNSNNRATQLRRAASRFRFLSQLIQN